MTTTLIRPTPPSEPLDQLSPREVEVLTLMSEGRSNRAIGELLAVELKTVETHVSRVFTKLGLNEDRHENRRVLAVLTFLGSRSAPPNRLGSVDAWGLRGA
jgi:DNA-binding NarL/FixJ family response regulator